jgi:hypothetical protein
MMEKPDGLTGDTVFAVRDLLIGRAKKPYYSLKEQTLLPVTVSIRVEHCDEQRDTVDHKTVESFLDFGITSHVRNPSNTRTLGPTPGLIRLDAIIQPFTPAKIAELNTLAQWHQNSMISNCAHQNTPSAPRWARPGPCPQTGYCYGEKWLVRPLPENFLARLRAVLADADPECIYDADKEG